MSDYENSLEAIAQKIEQSTEIKRPMTSGLERRDYEPTQYSPAQFIDKPGPAPAVEPSSGGRASSSGLSGYVTSDTVSSWHTKAAEAARPGSLPPHHTIAPTKAMRSAWEAVQTAMEDAQESVRIIPTKIAEATRERATMAGQSDEPVTLPNAADVRSHWEAKAVNACRAVVAARADYVGVIEQEQGAHHEGLGSSIPKLSGDVLARVADLESAIRDLRDGVSAYVEVAGNRSPQEMPARLPTSADLSALAAIQTEVEQLRATAENPSEPRIRPRLAEREAIMRRARQVPNGLTIEVLELARTERSEVDSQGRPFAHSSHTKAIPEYVLANFAGQVQAGGGSIIR